MAVYHQVPIHSFLLITVNQQEARLVRAFLFLAFPFCHTSYASQPPCVCLKHASGISGRRRETGFPGERQPGLGRR